MSETKPPDALSWAERRELLHPDGVASGLFIWGYVDTYSEGKSGVAWHSMYGDRAMMVGQSTECLQSMIAAVSFRQRSARTPRSWPVPCPSL